MAQYNATPNLPNNLYTNGAVTFDTRQLANMLYQEQKMRRIEQSRRDAELNDQISKEMAGVFSADRPQAAANFDRWKKAASLLRNPKIHKNRDAFLAAQQEEREAYSNFFTHTGKSRERKEYIKELASLKPEERSDEHGDLVSTYMTTPLEKIREADIRGKKFDLSNPDSFRNMGNFDWSKTVKENLGSLTTTEVDGGMADAKGLEKLVKVVEHYSGTPEKVKEGILNTARTNVVAKRTLEKMAADLTPEMVKDVDAKFAAIPESVFTQMGRKKSDFSADPSNPFDVAATYVAKKSMLDNPPRVKETKRVTNKAREDELQEEKERRMAVFNSNLRKGEIQLRDSLKDKGEKEQQDSVDKWLRGIEKEAIESGKVWNINHPNQPKIRTFQIPLTPSLAKSFERNKVQPNALGVDENGNYYPLFYKRQVVTPATGDPYLGDFEKKNGKFVIDPTLSVKVSRDAVKPEVANVLLSPKLVETSMGDDDEGEVGQAAAPKLPTAPSAPSGDWRSRAIKVN
jgi:hypothetical protein